MNKVYRLVSRADHEVDVRMALAKFNRRIQPVEAPPLFQCGFGEWS
ncbi:hypothetical protein PAMC26577_40545 [Caballeronia sordidicola]|uniref:Uncharacterized protein n=1 Tax=Caballeronia sordidicola TaxID=196367 RepID=A0A242M2F7_CABSO|nr:hypothetical protein PAMC26577_40545 [Caballeronia sordidicola]